MNSTSNPTMSTTVSTASASLECPVCLDFFSDPRIIECGHSICFKCLTSPVKCPLCRYTSTLTLPNLPINYSLKNIIEDFQSSNIIHTSFKCSLCTNKSLCRCKNCDLLLCQPHTNEHNQSPFMKNHKLIPSKDTPIRCTQHDEYMKLYCDTCHILICNVCFPLIHRTHQIITITDAANKERRKITELIECLKEGEVKLEDTMKALQTKIKEDEERMERLKEGIKRKKKELDELAGKQRDIKVNMDTLARVSHGPTDIEILTPPTRIDEMIQIIHKRMPDLACKKAPAVSISPEEWKPDDLDDHFIITGRTLTHKHTPRQNHLLRTNQYYTKGIHKWLVKTIQYNGGGNGYNFIGVANPSTPKLQPCDSPQLFYGINPFASFKGPSNEEVVKFGHMDTGACIDVTLDMDQKSVQFTNNMNANQSVKLNIAALGPKVHFAVALGALKANTYEISKLE